MELNSCRICRKCQKGRYLESMCALQKAWCLQQHLHASLSHLVASLCWLTSSQSTIHSGLNVCLANKPFFSPGCSVLLRTRSCSAFVVFFVLYRFIWTGMCKVRDHCPFFLLSLCGTSEPFYLDYHFCFCSVSMMLPCQCCDIASCKGWDARHPQTACDECAMDLLYSRLL